MDKQNNISGNDNKSGGESSGSDNDVEPVNNVKNVADAVLEQAKATAGEAYEAVTGRAASAIDDQKSEFTAGISGVAETVRRVSGAISEGGAENVVNEYAAKYAESAARKLEDAASYFERTDLKTVVRDVESYARRNPVIFMGGAFALGILAARFIKSSPIEPSASGRVPRLKATKKRAPRTENASSGAA
jgi:ElaB/YqjD/DUF883 family membrane-anchored ribosome-binding protein